MATIPESCYWDETVPGLVGNKRDKVKEYLRDGLIKPGVEPGVYTVLPTKGRHQVHSVDIFRGSCTCQAFAMNGGLCSHRAAVRIFLADVDAGRRTMPRGDST